MRLLRSSASFPPALRGAVAAIGNFDGVHLGHRALIAAARAQAAAASRPLVVITFEPHPRRYFVPAAPPFRLDALETKARLLEGLGVQATLALPFDATLAAQDPGEFVTAMLARDLGLSHAVVGYDFTFGKARAGDTAMLRDLGAAQGIGVTVVPAQGDAAEAYSSSRIRRLLESGDVAGANRIMARPWEIVGIVRRGDQRGRTIGFPTANVDLSDFLVPKFGVYAVRAEADGAVHAGVANLGRRPTFGKEDVTLEVHLFDFAGDLYDRPLRVEVHGFLRPEQKFAGLDALKAQIAADAAAARALLATA